MQKHKIELPTAPPVTGRVIRAPQQVQVIQDDPKNSITQRAVLPPKTKESGVAAIVAANPQFDDDTAQQIGGLLQEFVVELNSKKRFNDALIIARLHCNVQPQNLMGFYNEALVLFNLSRHDEAKEVLLNAPKTVWNYPQYYHNMACIEVGLGDLPAALKNATSAAHLNKNALRQMLKDPDLKPIWGPLKQNTKDIR